MQMVKELGLLEKESTNNNNNNGQENSLTTMKMYDKLPAVVGGSAVVVLSSSDCCMCHVAKRLLFSLGVGPTVIELESETDIQAVLDSLSGKQQAALPAIFIGGKLLGGVESLMASHINGSLVPLLKEAGALWL